ncbi:MAG TPA: hypothetical protein VIL86_14365 [Tepidisphaeraceae bacterium]|jgi:hypothetical protein
MLRKLVVLGVLVVPALAFAQPKAGQFELTLSGVGSNDKEFRSGSAGVNLGLGYFATQNAEISIRQSVSYSDSDQSGGGTSWDGSTRVAFDWHFDLDRWQPFLGISGGYKYGDNTRDTWIAGLEGGVKYYVHSNTFIYGIAEYQFDLRGRFGDGAFVYGLGIGTNW